MAILLKYAIQRGAQNPVTLPTQLPQSATTSHRWILDMLPRGKKLKPLFSEFQTYVNFLNSVNCDPEESAIFHSQAKGARIVQRQIQWGTVRVDELDGKNVFYWNSAGKDYQLDRESPLLDRLGTTEVFLQSCAQLESQEILGTFWRERLKWVTRDHLQYI